MLGLTSGLRPHLRSLSNFTAHLHPLGADPVVAFHSLTTNPCPIPYQMLFARSLVGNIVDCSNGKSTFYQNIMLFLSLCFCPPYMHSVPNLKLSKNNKLSTNEWALGRALVLCRCKRQPEILSQGRVGGYGQKKKSQYIIFRLILFIITIILYCF